jgi:phage terminase small subunit
MGVPSRLTEMQRKFSELLILYEGRKFDYECAVEAGYSVDNSRHMASRLQNAEYFPLVVKHIEQKHILHGKLDEDQNETEMNKEITELLKSNRKIINITPEDIIDIEETNESKQLSPPLTPTKTKSDQDSTP